LLAWIQTEEDDDTITDLTKKTVPKVLANTSSELVTRVLELRQELAKTSISKYHAMLRAVCDDDCLRGLTQFYGANRTGRLAGRIVQIQNLPQNKLKDIDLARQLVKERRFEDLAMLFGNVSDTLSQLIRTAFIARAGKDLIPCDFSAIEARIVAWLSWCQWRMDVFNTHGKIYEASAEQMFKLPAGSVTKKSPYRQKGKVAELACGYGSGVGGMVNMGALEMGIKEEELQGIIDAWREANPTIVALWYSLERAAKQAIASRASVVVPVAGGRAELVFTYESAILFIELPSGRRLAYAKARIEPEPLMGKTSAGGVYEIARAGAVTYEGTDQKTKRWGRTATYGGKLLENCIARGTLVVTDKGLKPIELITPLDRIYDGEEFVNHEGKVFKGVQACVTIDGVDMTSDHKVLTNEGWKTASQVQRSNGSNLWRPESPRTRDDYRQDLEVEISVPVRTADSQGWFRRNQGVKAGRDAQLRVSSQRIDSREETNARYVLPPSLRGLAEFAGEVFQQKPQSVEKLWGEGHNRVRQVARGICALLGRHGADIPARTGYRENGQLFRILPAELQMGYSQGELHEQTYNPARDRRGGSECADRHKQIHALLPAQTRLAVRQINGDAVRNEPVYDILNCGPRNRFAVMGEAGMFVVHNCCQAIARDALVESMLRLDEAGYDQLFTVHDEIVLETLDWDLDACRDIEKIMGLPIDWAPDLPLPAEGFVTPYYMKETD
jgi:hypothetical protein